MPRAAKSRAQAAELKFYQKLALNRYLLEQFGAESFQVLSAKMRSPFLEEIDSEGVTGFLKQYMLAFGDKTRIDAARLAAYDWNIVSHLGKINDRRDEKIKLKYFQYLSLLFVEHYLDEYFGNRRGLLDGLNNSVELFNAAHPKDAMDAYTAGDLNKLAIWNAMGSGKTYIMHINYHQYRHYARGRLDQGGAYILLTPKESLSRQHMEDFTRSGIPSQIFAKDRGSHLAAKGEISILENTKLDKRDGGKKVAVSRFGSRNVVFADEGHRGASGDTWYDYRNQLCKNGFSFEYSATFGQAVKASGKNALIQEYAKCVLFDYSYKYFYGDGYGKDYNIINITDDSDNYRHNVYLTACLMTYYQQKKLYLAKNREFHAFNLENPLLVFVGASVNAVRSERGRKVSDILNMLLFFRDFIDNAAAYTAHIGTILAGSGGIVDANNRDVFRNAFPFLAGERFTPQQIYADILRTVFNCGMEGATLHIENLKGIAGEIRLRLAENPPFGVINVGDDSALLKLCAKNGFHTGAIDFTESLFQGITKDDSTINLLLGSKKFTEGWSCWRVSTMGLLNVGRNEGSEIIQLFGRGVRLKGCEMSLKRSGFYSKDNPSVTPPRHIGILETLNVFGVRAEFMRQFKEYLEEEGVPADEGQPYRMNIQVVSNSRYKDSKLLTLRVKDNMDFKKHGPKPVLKYAPSVGVVVLDCYAKVQFEASRRPGRGGITKHETTFFPENLAFLNYNRIYFELQQYKNEKSRYNVNITKQDIVDLLHNYAWYKLLIPEEELKVSCFEDYRRFERIAVALLKKYFDRFYYMHKKDWEMNVVGYELVPVDDANGSFIEDNRYAVRVDNREDNEQLIDFLQELAADMDKAQKSGTVDSFERKSGDMTALSFPASLYNPLLYLAKNNVDVTVSPAALNESESQFIGDLRKYLAAKPALTDGAEVYITRNRSKKGVAFFEEAGFYPDFILWRIVGDRQHITFIDPHGMRNLSYHSGKVGLYSSIKEIERALNNKNIVLSSFILSPTKHMELIEKHISVEQWRDRNVLFMEEPDYIERLFGGIR